MPTVSLPAQPSIDQLRNQARELQRAVRSGDGDVIAHASEHYPGLTAADAPVFPLSRAQLVIARHYGFASWARLSSYVQVVAQYSRAPVTVEASDDAGNEFLRLACLVHGDDDGPHRWTLARQILAENPQLVARSIHVAAAVVDPAQVARLLDADPRGATREGGPFGWPPLLYLTYARHDPDVAIDAVLDAARLLLRHGADPNAGYLWSGLTPPFTALTGAFGHGEQGPDRQPAHPHQFALARLLLDAGADPNDGQALYNRMFQPDDGHLELLFEYGLGSGDGGPWHARLGDRLDTPQDMVRGQLAWAVTHDMLERTRLLVRHGVDIGAPLTGSLAMTGGRTPVQLARLCGYPRIGEYLVSQGADDAGSGPDDAFVAAVLLADREAASRIAAADPGVADSVRRRHPALIMRAAVAGRLDSIALLAELGFDLNAFGRQDAPIDQPWETPLHHAAGEGDLAMARLLLSLGANPDVRDARYDATPAGWARHFGQDEMAELLQPITSEDGLDR